MLPKVSLITVNYNQAKVTAELLQSLRTCAYNNLEIFVVDNASAEDCSWLKISFPEINLIKSARNLGFAGGNNLALKAATGDYLMLINNDTEVTPGFLEPILQTFQTRTQAGIVSPKLIFYHSQNLIQYAGIGEINPYTCRGKTRGYLQTDNGQFDEEKEVSLAHGACMVISRKLYNAIGGLYEDYFLFYEEFDYCEQAKKAGFAVYYTGFSKIYHKESTSVGKESPLKVYYMSRSRVIFILRNISGLAKFLALAFYFLFALPKNTLTDLVSGRWLNAQNRLKGSFNRR